jgi:membrane-associated PAP2 superfamily phosphatase
MTPRRRELRELAALTLLASLVFTLWPQLDLWISACFHQTGAGFPADRWPLVRAVYQAVPWIGRALFLACVVVLVVAVVRAEAVSRRLWRRSAALALCLLLGVGVLVNGVLKEHWGRPRPVEVQAFDGPMPYRAALQVSSLCAHNCSFVSGHAATGFALMAWGSFATRARRRAWLLRGAACGLALGLLRVAQGRHFASDIVFALAAVWASTLAAHWLWLRVMLWRRQRRVRAAAVGGVLQPGAALGSATLGAAARIDAGLQPVAASAPASPSPQQGGSRRTTSPRA